MNKLDTPFQTPTLTTDDSVQADHSFHRLLVLIPDDSEYGSAIRRVWEVANASGARILLLSLCKDPAKEPGLRRRLVQMAYLLQDGNVSAEWKVDSGSNWVEAVKRNSGPSDMVVCFAEQRAGLWRRPLSQILQSNLLNPIYILAGFSSQNPSQSNRLSQIMVWVGSIGIILSFGILQAQVIQLPEGWIQNSLLILSIIPEFWLILVWNNLFS